MRSSAEILEALFHDSLTVRHWPLARRVGAALAMRRHLSMDQRLGLAQAYLQGGDPSGASALLVAGMLAVPADAALATAHAHLANLVRWRAEAGAVLGAHWGEDELNLEPLAHHHAEDFAWQYHDPQIAERCCLPHFQSADQWHAWLRDCYAWGDQWLGAVVHRDWGFIGSVSLIRHCDLGFFYYWLGPYFQGRGYGVRAVALLLRWAAARHGLSACYAKVYADNIASRRALGKLGFDDIQVAVAGSAREEMFYRCGAPVARATLAEELHGLLDAMASEARPALLLQPRHGLLWS
ncbi:GNAT family N-acetyltransferase [Hylemonella sp. W303a]|uniref:GNAT family N-acetyltransferase n=1 Tax=Hylemonella sp. W303a TaxID=3389873 RepID=UPI00396AFC8F